MYKYSIIAVLILLLPLWGVLTQPKIAAFPGTTLDLGDAYHGQKAETMVTIKNVGTDTLKISEVKAACGCTATMISEKNLGPNDSGKVSITFNTQGYNGRASKQVYVMSNDSTNPKLVINFSTNVIQVLDLKPRVFLFDKSIVDSTYTKMITISNPTKQAINILSVGTKADDIKLSLMKKKLMPGEETQLQATFHPTKSGTFQGVIDLTVDHPVQPKFEIKYSAWVNRK